MGAQFVAIAARLVLDRIGVIFERTKGKIVPGVLAVVSKKTEKPATGNLLPAVRGSSDKQPINLRLSRSCRDMLDRLGEKYGLSRTGIIELITRQTHDKEFPQK